MKLNHLSRRSVYGALLIGILALTTRLTFISFYSPAKLAGGDPRAFESFAQGILEGRGFRSAVEPWLADRPPLYIFFLAGNFLIFGLNEGEIFIVQSIIGGIAASLFFLCCVRLLGEPRALVGGVLFALLPHFLLFTKQILTESLYISLLVFLLSSIILPSQQRHQLRRWLLVGLIFGLTALLRREALFPAGLMVVSLSYFLVEGNIRRWWKAVLLVSIASAVTVAPWLIRNWIALGSPMLSSSAGYNFLVGNNPFAAGGYTPPPPEWAAQLVGVNELEWNRLSWQLSLGWIGQHPAQFLSLLPRKLYRFYGPANNRVLDGLDLALVPLYVMGIIRILQRRCNWQLIVATVVPFVAGATLIALVFVGGWRYRIGLYPGLLLLAAYSLPEVWMQQTSMYLCRLRPSETEQQDRRLRQIK